MTREMDVESNYSPIKIHTVDHTWTENLKAWENMYGQMEIHT